MPKKIKSNIEKIKSISNAKPNKKKRFIPWGRTFTTNDNFLANSKTGSKKLRPIVAIDSNNKGEIIAVPLSSRKGNNRTHLKNYQDGKSYFKHFVEIEDDEGKPIKANNKFRENHKNMDVSKKDVEKIRTTVYSESRQKQRNKKLYIIFHNRYK